MPRLGASSPPRPAPSLLGGVARHACAAWFVAPLARAWAGAEPFGDGLAGVAWLCSAPALARLATWRDRTGRWDALDPLVIAATPLAVAALLVEAAGLLAPGALPWHSR